LTGPYTKNKDNEDSTIDGVNLTFPDKAWYNANSEIQEQFQFQTDYVLPTGGSHLRLDTKEISIT
jgi:hypothetical protein